jgi:hypothetical protein
MRDLADRLAEAERMAEGEVRRVTAAILTTAVLGTAWGVFVGWVIWG